MNNRFLHMALMAILLLLSMLMAGCGGMSSREKSMVGKYYIPALSDTRPALELQDNRRSVLRAIRPGELIYFVEGIWRVENDSLIIENNGASITIEEGDASLVGTVMPRVAYPIIGFEENVLKLRRGGIEYDYHRRGE